MEIYFSQLWSLGGPQSKCWQIWCLLRALFLVHSWLSFPVSSHSGRGTIIRALIPLWGLHPHDLITYQRPQPPPNTSTLRVRFQHMAGVGWGGIHSMALSLLDTMKGTKQELHKFEAKSSLLKPHTSIDSAPLCLGLCNKRP